jgi:uncharacterized membrane-anchored protein YjiN (DUF445 family)
LDDATRQRLLDQMKFRASALLVVAAGIFVVASVFDSAGPWMGYIRATAEASVIGGLADWFAVTALFRHPLGVPIPHTAIVPMRKDRLGRTLGNFVQNHFLSRDVLAERLRSWGVAAGIARWLSQPQNARQIARQVAAGFAKTVDALPEDQLKNLVHEGIVGRIRTTQVAPVLGHVLKLFRAGNKHQELLSEAVKIAATAVDQNHDTIRNRVKAQSPWWVPGAIDDRIYKKILTTIEEMLRNVGADLAHPLRAKFDQAFEKFVDRLEHSPEVIAKAEALKERWLTDPVVEDFTSSIYGYLRHEALRAAAKLDQEGPSGADPGAIEQGITAFGTSLQSNPVLLAKLEEFIIDGTMTLVDQYRGAVSNLIAETVAKWDPMVTSRRIELAIGRDLQFIRINGTLVGGLLGLLIYTVAQLVG